AVLVPPEPVTTAEARIERPLVLRVLLRDRPFQDLLEGDPEALQRGYRLKAHVAATTIAVTTAFSVATGSSTFQPKRMSWSYRSRGTVVRTHTKRNSRMNSLSRNQIGPGSHGPCQPPRKSVTHRAERVIRLMYSDIVK